MNNLVKWMTVSDLVRALSDRQPGATVRYLAIYPMNFFRMKRLVGAREIELELSLINQDLVMDLPHGFRGFIQRIINKCS